MGAFFSFFYGVTVYAAMMATFLYAIGFVGNLVVPKSIDTGAPVPLAEALLVNVLLLGALRRAAQRHGAPLLQALVDAHRAAGGRAQHLRARRERSRSRCCCGNGGRSPSRSSGASRTPSPCTRCWAVFWLGWAVLLLSTFLINHFELFGLRQVFARLTGREMPEPEFRTPLLYRYVRHPHLSRLPARVLGGAGDDGGAPAVRDRRHRLHPRRHLVRGARPRRAVRRPLPPLSRPGRDAAAGTQGLTRATAAVPALSRR